MKAQLGQGEEVNIYDIDDKVEQQELEKELDRDDDGLPPIADPFNPNNRSR